MTQFYIESETDKPTDNIFIYIYIYIPLHEKDATKDHL